jgi:hypothetical protein
LFGSIVNVDIKDYFEVIFSDILKKNKKIIKSQGFSHKATEIIQLLLVANTSDIELDKMPKIKKVCEDLLENYLRKTVVFIEGLSNFSFISVPYYLKQKITEIYYCLCLINSNKNLEKYKEIIYFEVISKILGYFYSLDGLKNCVMSLNIFEYIHLWLKDVIEKNFFNNITLITKKIIDIEVKNICSSMNCDKTTDRLAVFNFYYKILYTNTISPQIYQISNENSRKFIIFKVSKKVYKQVKNNFAGVVFGRYSAKFFELIIK